MGFLTLAVDLLLQILTESGSLTIANPTIPSSLVELEVNSETAGTNTLKCSCCRSALQSENSFVLCLPQFNYLVNIPPKFIYSLLVGLPNLPTLQ